MESTRIDPSRTWRWTVTFEPARPRGFVVGPLDGQDVVGRDPPVEVDDEALPQGVETLGKTERPLVGTEALPGGQSPETLVRGVVVCLVEPVPQAQLERPQSGSTPGRPSRCLSTASIAVWWNFSTLPCPSG